MTVLIMASGDNPEWIWSHYTKHTVPIAGEPLIVRTVKQLKNLGETPFIISHHPQVKDLLLPNTIAPQNYQTYAKTLLSTTHLWGEERTLILNGDVVWSDKALKFVVDHQAPIRFFSSCGCDILGFSFSKEMYPKFIEAARLTNQPWMQHFRNKLQLVLGNTDNCPWNVQIPNDGLTIDFDDTDAYEFWLNSRGWVQAGNPPKLEPPLICGMNKKAIQDKLLSCAPWNYTIKFPFDLDTFEPNNRDNEIEGFLEFFNKPCYERVFDLGASAGFYSNWFLENKNSYVISQDNDQRRLVQLHCIKYLKGFRDRMPIPQHNLNEGIHYRESDIDLVLVRDIINYLTNPLESFKEFYRVLKPGGECVVRSPKDERKILEQVGFNIKETTKNIYIGVK